MNDRKIKYVDLNGLKCFAEELKKYLWNHVLEFSIFNELKDRIEAIENQDFYKVVESYDNLPNPGLEKIIYLVPNNGSFLEYLWAGDKYEQLGSFTPQLSLDQYLKIEDSPFKKINEKNSIIVRGSNDVIGYNSISIGNNNKSSLKCIYFKHCRPLSSGYTDIYLSSVKVTSPTISNSKPLVDNNINGEDYFKIGDSVSLCINRYGNTLIKTLVITAFYSNGSVIRVNEALNYNDDFAIPERIRGRLFSDILNTENEIIANNVIIGQNNNIKSNKTYCLGYNNTIDNFIIQNITLIGDHLEATKDNEIAIGRYNSSNDNTIFSIGTGYSGNRKNAIEIFNSDSIFVNKIGGYDGTNSDSAKSIQTVINNINIESGKGKNSIIQKNHNNIATNENTAVFGSENKAGLNSYYYDFIKFETVDGITNAILYMRNSNGPLLAVEPEVNKSFVNPYTIGDIVSIRNNSIWYNCGSIKSIDHNKIVVEDVPFSEIIDSSTDREIFVAAKPNFGYKEVGQYAFVTGQKNQGFGTACHVEGLSNILTGNYSHGEGEKNTLEAYCSHVEGEKNIVKGNYSHTEGGSNNVGLNSRYSHTEGKSNIVTEGQLSHTEGTLNELIDTYDVHVEGKSNIIGKNGPCKYSHIEGQTNDIDNSYNDHIEGYNNGTDNTEYSHIEGQLNDVKNSKYSHVEGRSNQVRNNFNHVEGNQNVCIGTNCHVEGYYNYAEAKNGHVEGFNNKITNDGEHAQGVYNKSNVGTIHSIGIGTSQELVKNAHEVLLNGNHYIYGIGGYDGTNAVTPNADGILAKSVQEVINELINIINEITTSETN